MICTIATLATIATDAEAICTPAFRQSIRISFPFNPNQNAEANATNTNGTIPGLLKTAQLNPIPGSPGISATLILPNVFRNGLNGSPSSRVSTSTSAMTAYGVHACQTGISCFSICGGGTAVAPF